MLRGKIDQDHIPHQTTFSKDEFKNGIETPFELKLPGGLKFGPNAKVTYSREGTIRNCRSKLYKVTQNEQRKYIELILY